MMRCQICGGSGLELWDICTVCRWEQDIPDPPETKHPGLIGLHWSSANGCAFEVARDVWATRFIARQGVRETLQKLGAGHLFVKYDVDHPWTPDWGKIWDLYLRGRLDRDIYGDFRPVLGKLPRRRHTTAERAGYEPTVD
jgi:hypothetical protein